MTETVALPVDGLPVPRRLGEYSSGRAGPTVIALGGLHGNEPAGVLALERVLAELRRSSMPLRGRLVALGGNLRALARGQRYIERDLNRQWLPEQLAALRAQDPKDDRPEDAEQRELIAAFDECVAASQEPVVFIDLHTSSAPGAPFTCLSDTLPNRRLAMALPVPAILGLEETIDGAILEYFNERGLVGLAIEGGQHEDPETVDRLAASVWLALIAAGALPRSAVAEVAEHEATLRRSAAGVPPIVELIGHHKIQPGEKFAMRPGYESFQPIQQGEHLADNRDGEVRAQRAGLMLLPLYQGQGNDGFFLIRPVRRFWLRVAAGMRHLRLHKLLPLLPGVSRHPSRPESICVDDSVARYKTREVFHLLGYRRNRPEAGRSVYTRRVPAPSAWKLPWRGA